MAGIDPKFRFHDIIHTVASRLVTDANIDLATVAAYLGHANLMILQQYVHTRHELKMQAAEALCNIGAALNWQKNDKDSISLNSGKVVNFCL